MKLKLLPKRIKNLKELGLWLDKNILDTDTVIGIRRDCKIVSIKEFSPNYSRWSTFGGVPIYYQ